MKKNDATDWRPSPPNARGGEADEPPYLDLALAQIPRLLSRCDREPFSQTHGSFDRTYWCWKFSDFSGARFQESVYALAHLWSHEATGAPLAGHADILQWIRAGMAYWRRLQLADGSFNEAYPFEHSLAATAFTGFYVGEAYLLVREHLPQEDRRAMEAAFGRLGHWLCRNDETHGLLTNHLAAAAAALTAIHRITGDAAFGRRAGYFLDRIYRHQSPEGWYEEYGGADPGYQTHATFYLARVWQRTGDAQLLDSLRRATAFLAHCIHPDGTLGGEYASRNTEFYFPAGFEILAPACPEAASIALFMRPAVRRCQPVGLQAMDAYNFLPLLNNYLFADLAAKDAPETAPPLPCQARGSWQFPDAGLWIESTDRAFFIIGLSKGGVLKLFRRGPGGEAQLAVSDCGWVAETRFGPVSSQSLTRPCGWNAQPGEILVATEFHRVNQRVIQPWQFIAFRLFCLTFGRWRTAALWLKSLLVKVLISRKRRVPLTLTRRLAWDEDGLRVEDEIRRTGSGLGVSALWTERKFSSIHMGSARYFQYNELAMEPKPEDGHGADHAARLKEQGLVRTSTRIDLDAILQPEGPTAQKDTP